MGNVSVSGVVALTTLLASSAIAEFDVERAVKEDLRHVVRPGGVNGQPFWNGEAKLFMYPPSFDFPRGQPGWAKTYRFDVLDANGRMHVFETLDPQVPLTNIWEKLPTGHVTVNCSAASASGTLRRLGTRLFWKQAPFTGKYPPARRSYADAAKLGYEYVFNEPSVNYLADTGEMDRRLEKNCYPTKINSAIIVAMVNYAEREPSKRERALKIARAAADWLIAHSEPASAPLAFFPPTYQWEFQAAGIYAGEIMLIYPASAGNAFLRLHAATGEARYLEAAERIASTYLKLQGEDGTWCLKMKIADGSPIGTNRLVPIKSVMPFLGELALQTGKAIYRRAAERAFGYVERDRLRTWNWEGQFEDNPLEPPYANLTKHDACSCAQYLLRFHANEPDKIVTARELLRFAEDQFVCWETPFTDDYPDWYSIVNHRKAPSPCVLEQYNWYVPVDASAAKLVNTYLAFYRVEGNELDLLKAKALGDAITRQQRDEGWIATHWDMEEPKERIWLNCHIASVLALESLARVVEGRSPAAHPVAIYDGTQSNNVFSADISAAGAAFLSLRVASPTNENPSFVILAEYGPFSSNECMRLSFNGRHERRVCGHFGGVRLFSPPGLLDDGLQHHVALAVELGGRMSLYADGREVASAATPSARFPRGWLSVAQRVVTLDPREAYGWHKYMETMHFRGSIDDVRLEEGSFDPGRVAGGTLPRAVLLNLPPDVYASTPRWERPKTTRRYLQGPCCERLITYWREGKLVFGEIEHKADWSIAYAKLKWPAVWLVHGDGDEAFDFRSARLSVADDGFPCHAQSWREGPLAVSLAAAVPFGRRPSCHALLSVRNAGDVPIEHSFAFLLRADRECDLVFDAPDVYRIFEPRTSDWAKLSATNWVRVGRAMRSGGRFVDVRGADFAWDVVKGAVRFSIRLAPGEVREVEIETGKGPADGMTYMQACAAARDGWRREMESLNLSRLPSDENTRRMARNFAVQMLQCLSLPTEGDFVLPRQGGLQRYVWPGDAINFLAGLDLLGFGSYVEKVVDFYFGQCQRDSGEAGPFRQKWACDTACVLESFSRHCLSSRNQAFWMRRRASALRAFGWIERTRASGGGLFPAMKSTDHGSASRHWVMTDARNIAAYGYFAAAAEAFADPAASEVRRAEQAYRKSVAEVLDGWRAKSEGRDELYIPITADGIVDDALNERFMFHSPGALAELGFLSAGELTRLRRWLLRRGYAHERGLYHNVISRDARCREHVWYTTWSELEWMRAWMRAGRRDLARQALDASLLCAVTDEYYVGERYHDANPWFYPWSPNASGMGRILQMLAEMH